MSTASMTNDTQDETDEATYHSAIRFHVEEEAEEAMNYVIECMQWVPEWAQGLPLNCEAGYGKSYGDC